MTIIARTFASLLTLATVAAGSMAVAAQAPAATPAQGAAAAPAAPAQAPVATPKPATLGMFVYPGSGQEAGKQSTDENECYAWAHQQTGIDPTAAPAPAAPGEKQRGGAVRGAARGAAKGAAVGAIADNGPIRDEGNLDAGEGAGAGAVAGAAKGRRAQKKANKQAEAQAQQAAQSQASASKDIFKRAWSTCLEGRGYSVK